MRPPLETQVQLGYKSFRLFPEKHNSNKIGNRDVMQEGKQARYMEEKIHRKRLSMETSYNRDCGIFNPLKYSKLG